MNIDLNKLKNREWEFEFERATKTKVLSLKDEPRLKIMRAKWGPLCKDFVYTVRITIRINKDPKNCTSLFPLHNQIEYAPLNSDEMGLLASIFEEAYKRAKEAKEEKEKQEKQQRNSEFTKMYNEILGV